MSEWPVVSVLLITYKRYQLALRTVLGVTRQLRYPGPLHWHIADDGSGADHAATLEHVIRQEVPGCVVTRTDVQRRGVGASMNAGQTVCWTVSDYVLWLEDDWELQAPFDLAPCVAVLRECLDTGMVRLGYLQRGIKGALREGAGRLWWRLDWDSDDPYVFAGHASLRHRRFYEANGPYPEGLAPGETEEVYARRTLAVRGPAVLWPGWVGQWGPFGHIGAASLAGLPPGAEWEEGETRQTPTEGIGVAPEEALS